MTAPILCCGERRDRNFAGGRIGDRENHQPFDRLIEIARSDFATDAVLDDMQAIEADAD
jgi:hypothetical protein